MWGLIIIWYIATDTCVMLPVIICKQCNIFYKQQSNKYCSANNFTQEAQLRLTLCLNSHIFMQEIWYPLFPLSISGCRVYLPSQFTSSTANSYPVPHEHSNDPKVLLHIWLHPPLRVEHSSTSMYISAIKS